MAQSEINSHENYVKTNVIVHYANVFIVEDNILWELGGPSNQFGSYKNFVYECKINHN